MSAVMEKVLKTQRTFETVDEGKLLHVLGSLKDKHDSLFGIEEHARNAMKEQLAQVGREAVRLQSWKQTGLSVIDEVVLTWRNGEIAAPSWRNGLTVPMPTLALTSLHNPETEFKVKGGYDFNDNWEVRERKFFPDLPLFIEKSYEDIIKSLERISRRKGAHVKLSTTYHGVIPEKTKAEIKASLFNQNEIFLLREVNKEDWQLTIKQEPRPVRPRYADPLVVGIRDATIWLITSFDPTPLEEYVRDEFTLLEGGNLQLPQFTN